jgi:hypothetical protein
MVIQIRIGHLDPVQLGADHFDHSKSPLHSPVTTNGVAAATILRCASP